MCKDHKNIQVEIQARISELKDMMKTSGKVRHQEVTQEVMELQFILD
jgi:hypothetical protein